MDKDIIGEAMHFIEVNVRTASPPLGERKPYRTNIRNPIQTPKEPFLNRKIKP